MSDKVKKLNIFDPILASAKIDNAVWQDLVQLRASHFAGPDSYFRLAIEKAIVDARLQEPLIQLVQKLDNSFFGDQENAVYRMQWEFLKQYLNLRLGLNDNSTVRGLSSLFDEYAESWSPVEDFSSDKKKYVEHYGPSINKYSTYFSDENWNYSQFACLVLLQYLEFTKELPTERIPILLVTGDDGRCLELVAQRIPGPPNWIVPNWFQLGLAHLGKGLQLCRSINNAMYQAAPGVAIQWWLEANRQGFAWHDSIDHRDGATDSATIPAACIAKALSNRDPKSNLTLLDGSLAASGKLTADMACGPVTGLVGKIKGAQNTAIRVFFFPDSCDPKEKEAAEAEARRIGRQVRWVKTFEEAYESLLVTSENLQQSKKISMTRWDSHVIEVDTHALFFEASERPRTLDRVNATEPIESLIEGDEIPLLPSAKSLDEIFQEDGKLTEVYKDAENKSLSYFLVRQPFWYCEASKQEERWEAAKQDEEPEIEGLESGNHPPQGNEPVEKRDYRKSWRRITRQHLVQCALSPNVNWRHVALVCGAGLGKSTNFKYLEAAVNRQLDGRHPLMAICLEISDLERLHTGGVCDLKLFIEKVVTARLRETKNDLSDEQLRFSATRLFDAGRLLLLLDSLDQSDHAAKSLSMRWLKFLLDTPCKVWVSGRPYAFKEAENELKSFCHDWQFLRVGQLDEPEARQLIETGPLVRPLIMQ